jgi:hypothetical protein
MPCSTRSEKIKASIRAKVEHPFRVIKRQFGYVKVRYRGLKKNTAQLVTLFALVEFVDGAGQTDGSTEDECTKNPGKGPARAEKRPKGCRKRRQFERLRMKFRHLETVNSLRHLVGSYSDHP